MKKLLFLFFIINTQYCQELKAQNDYDSIIKSLKLDSISGDIPTYFTPGNIEIALELQKTITDASHYYEKKIPKSLAQN